MGRSNNNLGRTRTDMRNPGSGRSPRFRIRNDGRAQAVVTEPAVINGRQVISRDLEGSVKMWKEDKGYGFIQPDGGGASVFVHHTGIVGDGRRALKVGSKVRFHVVDDPKGRRAEEVEVEGNY